MLNLPPSGFTLKLNGLSRIIITPVHISEAFNPQQQARPPAKQYNGIWDTGATGSVITRKVADECGLKPFKMTQVHTAAGQATSPVYLINMVLPNKVGIANVSVTEGIIAGDVEVLIGMDIISKGDFAITNHQGKTTFSFRCPSSECIDFVLQEKNAKTYTAPPTAGRNDPCPCGSGKKYKKCHGK